MSSYRPEDKSASSFDPRPLMGFDAVGFGLKIKVPLTGGGGGGGTAR